MPVNTCAPCDCGGPEKLSTSEASFKTAQLKILCNILSAVGGEQGVRYDWEVLCDPANSYAPVLLLLGYTDAGVIISSAAFNPDGTAWAGDITTLMDCSKGVLIGADIATETTLALVKANQTNGTQKSIVRGGAKGATAEADVTSTPSDANHQALDVILYDNSGRDLDFPQENENWNAADHGVLIFGRDIESNPDKYRALALNTEGDLYVDLSDINGVEPLVGAGPTGTGSLRMTTASDSPDTIALQIIDDWDEADRAKVNLIIGQAGVDGSSGTYSAKTQRVVIATNQPAVPVSTSTKSNSISSYRTHEIVVDSGQNQVTIQQGVIDTAAAGITRLVSAPGVNKNIYILSYILVSAGDQTVRWTDESGMMSGRMTLTKGVPLSLSNGGHTILKCVATNRPFSIDLSAAVQVSGHFSFVSY